MSDTDEFPTEELTPKQRKQLRDVLNYALKADPDSLLRAVGEAVVKMNPPIDE
jgi:hypothetical protein